ncbi:MAG: VPDSG-CTERM sorting domain-containing protein [Verrucomicrobia bacterium]|nr:VPDSG-CTERM sorting domain-containing protein [Verrucomicrobiota bacterium]
MSLRRLAMVVFGISVALSVARADDVLRITETGEGFNDLSATYNGAPLTVSLSGTPDAWTVQLPNGYVFNSNVIGQGVFLNEPESTSLFDQVNVPRANFLTWISDIPATGAIGTNTFTFNGAGTGPDGKHFDLIVANSGSRVPDTGSTMALLAAGLGAIAVVARKRIHRGEFI